MVRFVQILVPQSGLDRPLQIDDIFLTCGFDAVVKIGELMLDPAARVMSLDLNPVLLDDAGKGCVVVDAVVFRGSA